MKRSFYLLTAAAIVLWTPAASALILYRTGLWRSYQWPDRLWVWWLWLPQARANPVVHAWLVQGGTGAASGLVVMLGLVMVRTAVAGGGSDGRPRPVKRGQTDNHGHAHWMPLRALKRLFRGNRLQDGIVVGEAYRVDLDSPALANIDFDPADRRTWGRGGKAPLLFDTCRSGPTHSINFAGSGGFKTTTAVSTLLHWMGSVVVLDPSCEMGWMTRRARSALGQRVVALSPETASRVGVNVLDCIDITAPAAEGHVKSVVGRICRPSTGKATDSSVFFSKQGRNLVTCLLADMLWDPGLAPEQKTLRALHSVITTREGEMKDEVLRTIQRDSHSAMARSLARTLFDMRAQETFSGIYGAATEATDWLTVRAYADLVSGNTFRTEDIASQQMTVFLQIPLETLIVTPEVARVLVGALMDAVYRRKGKLPGRVLFLLDEAAHLGRLDVLRKARDTGRKYGVTMQLFMQSVGQLDEAWGRDERRAWYDGTSWRSYATIRDLETARELSETFGSYPVVAYSKSMAGGRGEHEIKKLLVAPSELIADTRPDEQFVVTRGPPIRCGRAIYFRRPEMVEQIPLPEDRAGEEALLRHG